MTDCPDAAMRDRLPDYLHGAAPGAAPGAMDARERAAVAAHLATCAECRDELALLARVRGALDRAPAVDLDRIAAAVAVARPAGPRIVGDAAPAPRRTRSRAWRSAAAVVLVAGLGALPFLLGRTGQGTPAPRGDTVAVNDVPGATALPELTFGGGISELDEGALEALILEMEGVEALPHAEPAPMLSVDPLADAGAD